MRFGCLTTQVVPQPYQANWETAGNTGYPDQPGEIVGALRRRSAADSTIDQLSFTG